MSEYFTKPSSHEKNIKVEIDLTNYTTKEDIRNITHVDNSGFALTTNLSSLKTEVDKLDINKLVPIPNDLSKLSNVVKNDVVKKTVYNNLVAKVDNINTNEFVLKTKYSTDKTDLENKIPDTSNLVKKTDYNTKVTEIENKIPNISNLATKTALTTVENEILDRSNFATKTLVNKVENKIPDISNLATRTLLSTVEDKIPDISNLVKKSDYNTKITSTENNAKKLEVYDLSYFKGKQYFDEGSGKQNHVVFLPISKYFKLNTIVGVINCVLSWQSKGLSNESIKPPTTSNYSLNPRLSYYGNKIRAQFTGSCLKQPKYIFTSKKIVNIYIVYELRASTSHNNDPTLKNSLFGAVTLTKNDVIEKYAYSGIGTGFDRRSSFSFPSSGFGQNVLIFGVDMSSSPRIDNNKKRYISSWKRTNSKIRKYFKCRKKCILLILQ